jgi:hypothetical protein
MMVSQRALSLLGELRKSLVNDHNALFNGQDLVIAPCCHPGPRELESSEFFYNHQVTGVLPTLANFCILTLTLTISKS